MKTIMAALGVLLLCGCSQPAPVATVTPSSPPSAASPASSADSSPSPPASPSPLPAYSPSPLPPGTPVPAQVLSPARELPAVPLCSVAPVRTANGNVWPLFCRGGAINVQAWRFYAGLTPSVLAAGSKATSSEAYAALCRDAYVTNVEREYGFELAAAYYGWKFSLDPTRVSCQ